MESKQYLSESEVSSLTGLATPTLRNYRHLCKGIPYIKVGRRVLYDLDDVENFMADHRIETVPCR